MAIRAGHFLDPEREQVERSIGLEVENTVQVLKGSQVSQAELAAQFTHPATLDRAGVAHHDRFLGSRYGSGKLYYDCGMIEFDTAEAMGPAAAAYEDMRGIERLGAIVAATKIPHSGIYRTAGSDVPPKRGQPSKSGVSTGCHENFLIPRVISDDTLIDWLLPSALALRAIWAGAGALRRDGFWWSQKVVGIGGEPICRYVGRRTAHGGKPMVLIPPTENDVNTIGDDEYARAEVRFADPSMSIVEEFLSLADISLTLRLIELQRVVGREILRGLCLADPVGAAYRYARDITLKHAELTLDGQTVTALDGQEKFVETFELLDDQVRLPPSEKLAIAGLRSVVDSLRGSRPEKVEYTRLARARLAAVRRHLVLSKDRKQADLKGGNAVIMAQNLQLDRIIPLGKGLTYWRDIAAADGLAREVMRLGQEAGLTKRARHRAAIIDGDGSGSTVVSWASYLDGKGKLRRLGNAYGE